MKQFLKDYIDALLNSFNVLWPAIMFVAYAGMCNAAMDSVAHKYHTSIWANFEKPEYYNPAISWKNKWKLDKEGKPIVGKERYFGSSTFLVRFTDFWHLAKSCTIFFLLLSVVLYGYRNARYAVERSRQDTIIYIRRGTLLIFASHFVLLYLTFTITFELMYRLMT